MEHDEGSVEGFLFSSEGQGSSRVDEIHDVVGFHASERNVSCDHLVQDHTKRIDIG